MKYEKCDNNKCEARANANGSCGLCCTKVNNFSVKYGNEEVLTNVNIHIHCGELTAVIGPNGAGKSTLLKAILGDVKHTGELKFLDIDGKRSNRPVIGYVPQNIEFDRTTPMTVEDFFASCLTNFPVWLKLSGRIKKVIKDGLERVKAIQLIGKKMGNLSGGELQRLLLAVALSPVPDILLLDEPVSGIDHSGLLLFYELVSELRKKYDMTIILVSHDLDLVQKYADRVIFLNRSVECSGKPAAVFKDVRVREAFGINFKE